MKKTDFTANSAQMNVDVWEFSGVPALARMVQERLSRIGPQGSRDVQNVLREARRLRQRLVQDATSSYRHCRDRTS